MNRISAGPTADDQRCVLQWAHCPDSGLVAVNEWTLKQLSEATISPVPLVWYPSKKTRSKLLPEAAWHIWEKYVASNHKRFQSITFVDDKSHIPARPSKKSRMDESNVVINDDGIDVAIARNVSVDDSTVTDSQPRMIDLDVAWDLADKGNFGGPSQLKCSEVISKGGKRKWVVIPIKSSETAVHCPEYLCPSSNDITKVGTPVYDTRKKAERARKWLVILLHSNKAWRRKWIEGILDGRNSTVVMVSTAEGNVAISRLGDGQYLMHADGQQQVTFIF